MSSAYLVPRYSMDCDFFLKQNSIKSITRKANALKRPEPSELICTEMSEHPHLFFSWRDQIYFRPSQCYYLYGGLVGILGSFVFSFSRHGCFEFHWLVSPIYLMQKITLTLLEQWSVLKVFIRNFWSKTPLVTWSGCTLHEGYLKQFSHK